MHFKLLAWVFLRLRRKKPSNASLSHKLKNEDGCRKIPHLHNMNGEKHFCWKQNVFETKFSGPNYCSRSFFPRKTAAKKKGTKKMHWLHVFFRESKVQRSLHLPSHIVKLSFPCGSLCAKGRRYDWGGGLSLGFMVPNPSCCCCSSRIPHS